jgi:hypothetical protein
MPIGAAPVIDDYLLPHILGHFLGDDASGEVDSAPGKRPDHEADGIGGICLWKCERAEKTHQHKQEQACRSRLHPFSLPELQF